MDIHPINPGHVLVVPKVELQYIWDLGDDDYQYLMSMVKIIGNHIRDTVGCQRVGLIVEGFDVPHAHVKLIPLYHPDDLSKPIVSTAPVDDAGLTAMADKLRMN